MFDWNTVLLLNFKNFLQKTSIKFYKLINKPRNIYNDRCEKNDVYIKLNWKMRHRQKQCENKKLYYIAQTIEENIE